MKLNLACGTDIKPPPWVNLDIVKRWPLAARDCDVIWDARTNAIPFTDNSVDEAYCGTLFLHLAPEHHDRVLADIYRVLRPGGVLVVSEVAMDEVMHRWIANPRDERLCELIWGEQGGGLQPHQVRQLGPEGVKRQRELSSFDKHCHGFTASTLPEFMARGGFRDIQRVSVQAAAVWYELTFAGVK